ncbi:MAG: hypothetical protein Ct9H300mP29_1890 [Candidatus Neomarinimicrobiota bacterium]|nr:MAG: hypothetical protein Ct9H300mP29_1890 [Candidatus Neomarinimicrobiota bacterium]
MATKRLGKGLDALIRPRKEQAVSSAGVFPPFLFQRSKRIPINPGKILIKRH